MQLSDVDLRALLPQMNVVCPPDAVPFDPEVQVQPASIDLRVDRVVWRFQPVGPPIDLTNNLIAQLWARRHFYKDDLGRRGVFRLAPGALILSRTLEKFTVPEGFAAQVFTRSSFGRLGISVTCTAGYINPGYRGQMPLQIKNVGKRTVVFNAGISICQLVLVRLTCPSERSYGAVDLRSKYTDDDGGPSRWWQDALIQRTQAALGATQMPADVQDELLRFLLARDISTQDRFAAFLKKAQPHDLESVDAALDAFSRRERVSRILNNVLSWLSVVVGILASGSIGAVFAAPYGPLHFWLWSVSGLGVAMYAPVLWRKIVARNADYFLPDDLAAMRTRNEL